MAGFGISEFNETNLGPLNSSSSSSNSDFLDSLGGTTSISDITSDLSFDSEGTMSQRGNSNVGGGGLETAGAAIGAAANVTSSILQGVLSNKSVDAAKSEAQQLDADRRTQFLADQAENQRVLDESFKQKEEGAALRNREAELGLRLKKFIKEFKDAGNTRNRVRESALRLKRGVESNPGMFQKSTGR